MFKIECTELKGRGVFQWHVRGRPKIRGISREPLLDACRKLKSLGENPLSYAGLFRPERQDWDVRTTIREGAATTVFDPPTGGGPRFVRYKPFKGLS